MPYLIAISFMWGSAYLFLKVSSAEIPPLLLAALRAGVAFSSGAGAVYARWARPNATALIASGQLSVAACVALFASILADESWQLDWSRDVFFSVFMLRAFCTALTALLFLVVISRYKAVKVGAASFLQPIWAIALGSLFLAKKVCGLQLLGFLIILLSVLAITTAPGNLRKTGFSKDQV
ncbi:MAG: EamA family transporter [Pseudomonadota bacterium]